MKKNMLRATATLMAMCAFALIATAQTSPRTDFPNIKIGNFGQMDEHFYRGAQPLPDDYKPLAALGVKTVIDLRDDPTDYEKADAEAAGMKYINIPMSGVSSPKTKDVNAFLKLLDDPSTGTVYVHCKAGIHRTGVMGAAYRYTKYSWGFDQVYKEMKNYQFSSGLVHGSFKSFVRDYPGQVNAAQVNVSSAQKTAKASQ